MTRLYLWQTKALVRVNTDVMHAGVRADTLTTDARHLRTARERTASPISQQKVCHSQKRRDLTDNVNYGSQFTFFQ